MRPSVRFEVFKRDGFTCCYCGRKPPTVTLEVDHIVPRAAGGEDILENLTTACFECNRGKSDRSLDAPVRTTAAIQKAEDLKERTLQAQAYAEAIAETRKAQDHLRDMVCAAWCDAWEGEVTDGGWKLPKGTPWPNDRTISMFLRRLPIQDILDAVDITVGGCRDRRGADRYFYAVCWRMIKRAEES